MSKPVIWVSPHGRQAIRNQQKKPNTKTSFNIQSPKEPILIEEVIETVNATETEIESQESFTDHSTNNSDTPKYPLRTEEKLVTVENLGKTSFSTKQNKKCDISELSPDVLWEQKEKKYKPLQCHICEKYFTLEIKLKLHIDSVHEGKKPYKCDICDSRFIQKSDLTRHIRSVHEKKLSLIHI